MIILVSPSKTQQENNKQLWDKFEFTTPEFIKESSIVNNALIKTIKEENEFVLYEIFQVNEFSVNGKALLKDTIRNIEQFEIGKQYPAIFYYHGLVFKEILGDKVTVNQIKFLNKNLFIMSAYYGLVKPLDQIKNYRLMMESKIQVEGARLVNYWKEHINYYLEKLGKTVINLSSKEYTQALDYKKLKIIDFDFLVNDNGKIKSIATYKKIARGKLINYLSLKNKLDMNTIKSFNFDGYQYNSEMSTENKLVFIKNGK